MGAETAPPAPRIAVHEARAGYFGGFHREPGVEMLFPGSAFMKNHPVGVGLTGGGWNIPLPCLMRLPLNGFRWETPTSRPLPPRLS